MSKVTVTDYNWSNWLDCRVHLGLVREARAKWIAGGKKPQRYSYTLPDGSATPEEAARIAKEYDDQEEHWLAELEKFKREQDMIAKQISPYEFLGLTRFTTLNRAKQVYEKEVKRWREAADFHARLLRNTEVQALKNLDLITELELHTSNIEGAEDHIRRLTEAYEAIKNRGNVIVRLYRTWQNYRTNKRVKS